MRILITGHKGQLGQALMARLPEAAGLDLPEVDITDPASVGAAIEAARPEIIIHCAAMTDVDGAARHPEAAYRINGMGTQNVALTAERVGAALAYITTNEVFDGAKREPYFEFDPPHAINPYGQSKLAGEWFVTHLTARFYVIRIAWLAAPGGRNFVHRIQQLADERGPLKVVTDEVANPTFVGDLAEAIVQLISTGRFGLYHLTNSGYCSRYDYAKKILELTGRGHLRVEPITLAEFPRPSTPPKFTPLANTTAAALGITLRPWEEALAEFLKETSDKVKG
ncbi:MAG TPA: dTDP-4-dehydrorhamnose reductase [Anaerolineales bacterium]|nr:dTDP-4-dehydrorhamnose reductase [Anaerolineales bacterium]